jgi:hypothetical protein
MNVTIAVLVPLPVHEPEAVSVTGSPELAFAETVTGAAPRVTFVGGAARNEMLGSCGDGVVRRAGARSIVRATGIRSARRVLTDVGRGRGRGAVDGGVPPAVRHKEALREAEVAGDDGRATVG